ncbi:hypothetical protein WICMUC_000106 [Wickerhamomyces mucosus]|uniref:Uncharacterized protein n=1 Tax=Wickerhamomyces mucosus TaxID=1378264 RepID=A0A9P8TIJ0_9ASCO|nr:hypothetical protein WICMUC_000106 [Wickerhamomyces mucosus]
MSNHTAQPTPNRKPFLLAVEPQKTFGKSQDFLNIQEPPACCKTPEPSDLYQSQRRAPLRRGSSTNYADALLSTSTAKLNLNDSKENDLSDDSSLHHNHHNHHHHHHLHHNLFQHHHRDNNYNTEDSNYDKTSSQKTQGDETISSSHPSTIDPICKRDILDHSNTSNPSSNGKDTDSEYEHWEPESVKRHRQKRSVGLNVTTPQLNSFGVEYYNAGNYSHGSQIQHNPHNLNETLPERHYLSNYHSNQSNDEPVKEKEGDIYYRLKQRERQFQAAHNDFLS